MGEDGQKHRPIMIHRVIFGSIERFIGILTEHYAGAFPLWLAPQQVVILPISEAFQANAEKIEEDLQAVNIRASVDKRNEKIGYKIRQAQLKKIPYMLVVGEKEVSSNTVSVRSRKNGDLGSMSLAEFISTLKEEIENKK